MAYSSSQDQQDIYQYSYTTPTHFHHYVSDGSIGTGDESNFWSSSPRSETPSPNNYLQNTITSPYQIYRPITYTTAMEHLHNPCKNEYLHQQSLTVDTGPTHVPFVRVVKRRSTANKKERRRTMSINNAYADLRDCIPNVPADTKLSKIKTLRLATSYIAYLTRALETDDPAGGFKAELSSISRKSTNNFVNTNDRPAVHASTESLEDVNNSRKAKGRTGWPQHVWALELKQEQTM